MSPIEVELTKEGGGTRGGGTRGVVVWVWWCLDELSATNG